MAIATETVTVRGRQLTRTYSTEGRYVVHDGVSYVDAVDPLDSGREYTEGDLISVEESKFSASRDETGADGTEEHPYAFEPGKALVMNAFYTSPKKFVYMPSDAVPHAYDSWDDAADAMVAWDE